MERLGMNCLPQIPKHLFELEAAHTKLLHINIGNLHSKTVDMKCDKILKNSDVICISETYLSKNDSLEPRMLDLGQDMKIYRKTETGMVEE